MKFNEFINQAWNDHATQPEQVAERLADGIKAIEIAEQISQLAQLATHVFGEHLGKWDKGIGFLKSLKQNPHFEINSENDRAVSRSIKSLELASGKINSVEDFSTSDQIRILAVAASALSEQKNAEKAQEFFRIALEKAQTAIAKEDPANRALAVTGNNLASNLEEKPNRTNQETELMILAAQTGRKFWELAGTWLHVERAEYRLSMSYRKAGDLAKALEHAQTCIEISKDNSAPALELFFGFEALALVEKSRNNPIGLSKAVEQAKIQFDALSADDKAWCSSSLANLNS
jgi:tetratricopeptide (TPR) repeat protein